MRFAEFILKYPIIRGSNMFLRWIILAVSFEEDFPCRGDSRIAPTPMETIPWM